MTVIATRLALVPALLLILGGCAGPTSADALFDAFTVPGSPGATAMVIRDGEIIHANGYGLAELSSGRTLKRITPVRLASVSKQFTCMAVMMLKERGELAFDDPVTKWVPELARFPGIRVHHLMQHTSGLPDYYELPDETFQQAGAADGDPLLTIEDAVKIYERWGEPIFKPGERFEYSNPGYEMLAIIVQRISGQSFGAFMDANIFEPLGMSTTVVSERPTVKIPDRVVGYRPEGGGWVEDDEHFANWMVGAGSMYASIDDLYLWDQALYTETLVSKETLDEAFASAKLNDGSSSDYGFGWGVSDRLGRRAVHHGGSWVGFRTCIIRFLDERLTVIVLSNASADANGLADELAEWFLAASAHSR
jgi:CubicO group peptidase (beta-lactamase class C family)